MFKRDSDRERKKECLKIGLYVRERMREKVRLNVNGQEKERETDKEIINMNDCMCG